ncbi:hypothetical protein GXW71_28230 [Roseomonas hellenica]|uniref:Toprim domain-containing protein n=1 Tax=Plastoroseomonas hellenica TaxID=2687306 RepID=A0ABS5F764_9PROT|nr:toprim domain-containing protein [Plastoroseomonas hellenica]MBR0668273.1 hypothetical protein [Plastoroseomonas hellenica]
MTATAQEIAAALGLRPDGGSYRGRCPVCGYGGDTLAVRDGDHRAVFHCHNCADGPGIASVIRAALGEDAFAGGEQHAFDRAAIEAREAERKAERERAKAKALEVWNKAVPIDGTPAQRYLAGRGLPGVITPALRFGNVFNAELGRRVPAMIGAVTRPGSDEVIGIHRTFIDAEGNGKARDVLVHKKTLGQIGGAVVALDTWKHGETLVIAEGVETALSAKVLVGHGAAWAAIAANNLPRLALRDDVRDIFISADPDEAGQREAWAAAARFKAEGRRVTVGTPRSGDANDELMRRLGLARQPASAATPPWEDAPHG